MKTIGRYKIDYCNGIVQEKFLIRQSDFENVIKPIQKRIYDLQIKRKDNVASILKKELNNNFSDSYFTTNSPMAKAIKNGYMSLSKNQGGNVKCFISRINENGRRQVRISQG